MLSPDKLDGKPLSGLYFFLRDRKVRTVVPCPVGNHLHNSHNVAITILSEINELLRAVKTITERKCSSRFPM